ncbi:MAG: protein kinase domain-containing protein, partial [Thermoanaerobaculia bacterium]
MTSTPESSLLRLAIAKGLLRWEDLDSVADHLPDPTGNGDGSPAAPEDGRWVRALVEAGFLTPETVARLAAELAAVRDDATPDLAGGILPFPPAAGSFVPAPAPGPAFPPELRFLEDWTRYRAERLLGAGGMGTVCKAFDPTLGRWVALKFLHRNGAVQAERFLREARAQARVSHPNVCQVHEVGEVEGRPYIAMQYIEGRSLGELTEELSLEDKVRLLRDVARAVHAAHRTGLIHRDLKPGNILLARDARDDSGELHPYVVDFGLAMEQDEVSLSRTGMISGTPAYISPEQAQGRPLDRRTDLYSLGVVLYELLAGQPPFRGGNLARILVQVVQEDARPLRQAAPSIPEDLETIVAKCLEKDPTRRYESARDLAEDLDRFLDGEPIHARPAGWGYRARKRLRKHRALALVSAAALLAFLILGGLSLRAQWRAREKAELAQRFGQRIGAIQTSLRYEATLPRHDITPHKRRLLQEMETIRAEMRRLGAIAEGPGNSVLGQSYLALHQYEAARLHLERAWKGGERGPELAAALGQTLGFFYERSLSDSSLQGSAAEASREEADRAYRRPALAYLREAAAEPGSSPYLAALIAYYEKRYPQALTEARRAYLQTPWLHEASQIEASVFIVQGSDAANAGRYEEALHLFDRAGEVYGRLLAATPSQPGLYAADCDRSARSIAAAMAREDVPETRVAAAIASCDRALEVDPELADAMALEASIFWRLGDQKAKRGSDPSADLTSGIRLANRAIALDPRSSRGYEDLVASHRLLAQWKLGRGVDAQADIQRSIQAARKAVEIQPDLASNHSALGTAYYVLVLDQQRQGIDPQQTLKQATASYERAIALNPR